MRSVVGPDRSMVPVTPSLEHRLASASIGFSFLLPLWGAKQFGPKPASSPTNRRPLLGGEPKKSTAALPKKTDREQLR